MRLRFIIMLSLALVTLIAYRQVFDAGFTNYDDPLYVTKNRHVKAGLTGESVRWAFTATHSANWHPLTWISHMADCQLYGAKQAKGHHTTNLLFHIANTLLLFLVLVRMTGSTWKSGFVAALFAVHPLHVQSVAWIAERKDVLSTFFWLLTMWAYARYAERPSFIRYLPVIFIFALGLMSKPMLVTLPLALFLMDFWPLGRLKSGWKLVWEKIPLLAMAGISCVVTFIVQQKGGAVSSLDHIPLGIRIANALVAYVSYLWKTIWPGSLAVFYPHPGNMLSVWTVIGSAILLACITIWAVRVRNRRPYLAAGWLWYLITLVPVIGLIQVGFQAMADRYTYVPLIGIFIIIAWGVPDLLHCEQPDIQQVDSKEIHKKKKNKRQHHNKQPAVPSVSRSPVLIILAVPVIVSLAVCTWIQTGYWHDSVSLFQHAIDVTKGNHLAHYNLGTALDKQKRIDEAIANYEEALKFRWNYPQAHNNLGIDLAAQGEVDDAIAHYKEAIHFKPNYPQAYNNLGYALNRLGKPEEAIEQYRKAIELKSNYIKAHIHLADSLAALGKLDQAVVKYLEVLETSPNNPEAHSNLGEVLLKQGEVDGAIEHFSETARIDPASGPAHHNLAVAFMRKSRYAEAWKEFHLCQKYGINPNPRLLQALAQKMPEPRD